MILGNSLGIGVWRGRGEIRGTESLDGNKCSIIIVLFPGKEKGDCHQVFTF